jgi:hypothetical protein
LACFIAYGRVMAESRETVTSQQNKAHKYFHGDAADISSTAMEMYNGVGDYFPHLWTIVSIGVPQTFKILKSFFLLMYQSPKTCFRCAKFK